MASAQIDYVRIGHNLFDFSRLNSLTSSLDCYE